MKKTNIILAIFCSAVVTQANANNELATGLRNIPHFGCMTVKSMVASGNNRYVVMGYNMGHDTCDKNQLFVSRNKGQDFVGIAVGPESCAELSQVEQCGTSIYITQSDIFSGLFRVFQSKDSGETFNQIYSTNLNNSNGHMNCQQFANLTQSG